MNQQVAVVHQNPFRLGIAFNTGRQFPRLLLQLDPDFVADGLNLALVGPRADHEEVRKRGDSREVQHLDFAGFLGFGGAYGNEPGRRGGANFLRLREICLPQNTLLSVSYYNEG